jgi:hypothetical protein
VHGLRGLLPPSSVPGPLRPHDIGFGQRSLIGQSPFGILTAFPWFWATLRKGDLP